MMSAKRAPQTISSSEYAWREWMVWLKASSSPITEAMTSARPSRSCSRVRVVNGLSGVIGWITSQERANTVDWLRKSRRSRLRRIEEPSAVVSVISRVTRICASATWLARSLARRNMSEGTPS